MTEETTYEETPVLIPESLEILKSKLSVNPYTDKQLNRAAMFLVAPAIALAAEMGVADPAPMSTIITANLAARTVLAEFINKGCVSVQAIDRFMDYAEKVALEELTKGQAKTSEGDDGEPT